MFDGWLLIGMFPEGEYADVGSWILHHDGEAALLEIPEGIAPQHIDAALRGLGSPALKFATASHTHEDHFDVEAWEALQKAFASAKFIHPASVERDRLLRIGGEPCWLIPAPKHSPTDLVTVFRGVAMTGDIELGMLESVNDEVPDRTKRRSMKRLLAFPQRRDYHVHTVVSAHVNDVRINVDWGSLFAV